MELIALTLISSDVAADGVFLVGTRLAALVGLQQMAKIVGAATRIARVNGRAARGQSHG